MPANPNDPRDFTLIETADSRLTPPVQPRNEVVVPEKRDAAIAELLANHGIVGYDAAAKIADSLARIYGGRPMRLEDAPPTPGLPTAPLVEDTGRKPPR